MNAIFRLMSAAMLIVGAASCQKVIDVNLNSSAQKFVIEGEVTDGPGPYSIHITRTRDFSEDNNFDRVSGALVRITDETIGLTDTLRESTPGTYTTSVLAGVPGHTYALAVQAEGQAFTANSTMPAIAVKLDTIYVQRNEFGGDFVFIIPKFTDPVGVGQYYRLRQWVNDTMIDGSRLRSDDESDGRTYDTPLFYNADEESGNPRIRPGSAIAVELQSINRQAYDYYRTLRDATGENSATPANPISNIKGGALGVFNTCTSNKRTGIAVY